MNVGQKLANILLILMGAALVTTVVIPRDKYGRPTSKQSVDSPSTTQAVKAFFGAATRAASATLGR